MRTAWLKFLLMCLLVLAQAGSLAHEISHHGGPLAVRPASHADQGADGGCSLCIAFAGVAVGAPCAAAPLALLSLAGTTLPAPVQPQEAGRAARGHNRDPPAAA